jgi:putative ABC transport system ATP-binding protein
MSNEVLIQIEHLNKTVQTSQGEIHILKDINFTLHAKEIVAILGSSGSGKTTLLSIMAGLDPNYLGSVKLFGQELSTLSENQRAELRKSDVGFVFQSFLLIPELTALENICLPLEIANTFNPESLKHAQELLEKIGLSERANHYPATLSGGEQQRIALARAFIVQPKILFLDEPTGSLDSENGKIIIETLFQFNQDLGTTIVMVTHDSEISQQCGRILTLKGGKSV